MHLDDDQYRRAAQVPRSGEVPLDDWEQVETLTLSEL